VDGDGFSSSLSFSEWSWRVLGQVSLRTGHSNPDRDFKIDDKSGFRCYCRSVELVAFYINIVGLVLPALFMIY